MEKSAQKIYGILGYPAKHSFSPAMHNAAFRALGINAEYRIFEKEPGELEDFLTTLPEQNIAGLNVTVPYKEKVLPWIALFNGTYLKQLGAINTIKVLDDILEGNNTDLEGFYRHLQSLRIMPHSKRVALLGAGGAAKVVAYVLTHYGAKEVRVYDIDTAKSSQLVDRTKSFFASSVDISSAKTVAELDIPHKDILINATPVGMKDADPCLIDEAMLHRDLFVYDLIYTPAETKLLKLAKAKGAQASNGLGMLLYQGMLSFEYWTGQCAPEDVMRQALQKELEKCQS